MIGYHYSPTSNRFSIAKHGLLVPKLHPKLVVPVVCSEGHLNPHISLAKSPAQAWDLSGGFLLAHEFGWLSGLPSGVPMWWDLYQVWLQDKKYKSNGYELQSRKDIQRKHVVRVGFRSIDE